MVLIDDTEMQGTEPEAAVSSFDDGKIVADTPDFIDGSSLVVRTATGVRISAQFDEQTIIASNGFKSDPSDSPPVTTTLEVTDDESVTTCDGVIKDIVESDRSSEEKVEIFVKEEPDLPVENGVSGQGEEMVTDSIEKSVVGTVSSASGYDYDVKIVKAEEPGLRVENPVSAHEEETIFDSIAKSVVETVSRGSEYECVNVKVKEEPDLGSLLEDEPLENCVFSNVLEKKDEVIRVQQGQGSETHGSSQEIGLFLSGDSAKRRKTDMEQSIPSGVIIAAKPLRVFKAETENLDAPEVIDVEESVKQEKSETHVKMEPVEVIKVDALSLSSQQRSVYVKKEPLEARKVNVEDGDFPVEKDWFLVGRSLVTATSTSKGRKLEDNEVVDFKFPTTVNWKVPNIVRFSNKRCGEVSQLFFFFDIFVFMFLNVLTSFIHTFVLV